MPDRVRIGVIGTSGWTDLYHLPAVKSHPRAELAAICGRNAARAGDMARKYDIDDLPLSPSFYDGLKAQEVIGAAVESHETGRWVTIPANFH